MEKIRLLSQNEVAKIAAGQVVERPVSIVKELIENSIDAGATRIDIYVEHGGKDLIRVVDNGCGMCPQDAQLAFAQHTTSKISILDDLNSLTSYGFRGEALASIAAVSHMQLITKESTVQTGTRIIVERSQLMNSETVACPDGTEIEISKLFDAVPARKKFLKTVETEFNQIQNLVHAYVLAHEQVHMRLFHDGKLIHNCPPVNTLEARLAQLWDIYSVQHMCMVQKDFASIGIGLNGLISDHAYGRYNSAHIYLFVNKRWIKNTALVRALIKGYANIHQPGKFPAALIFITTDPSLIDVNIHPRKEEVQFVHACALEKSLQALVQEQLEERVRTQLREFSPASGPFVCKQEDLYACTVKTDNLAPEQEPVFFTQKNIALSSEQSINARIIGQYHNTYIMLEQEDGIIFIDQHAAHERIIYQELANQFEHVPTMPLLFAQMMSITEYDIYLFRQHQTILACHGVIADIIGPDRLAITAISLYLKNTAITEVVRALLDDLHTSNGEQDVACVHHAIRARMACAAAVKAGDVLLPEKMREIVQQLERCQNKLTCPHGRPTTWLLQRTELEKKFKRDYIQKHESRL